MDTGDTLAENAESERAAMFVPPTAGGGCGGSGDEGLRLGAGRVEAAARAFDCHIGGLRVPALAQGASLRPDSLLAPSVQHLVTHCCCSELKPSWLLRFQDISTGLHMHLLLLDRSLGLSILAPLRPLRCVPPIGCGANKGLTRSKSDSRWNGNGSLSIIPTST
eukprot:3669701-Pyramimonas_sp.AAC.1